MVGCYHQLNGYEQALGDGEGQGGLASSPWGRKESDTTEQLNNNSNLFAESNTTATEQKQKRK